MVSFFDIIVLVLIALVLLKFVSFFIASRSVRYNDWVREQRRLTLLETVRTVRKEAGDYDVYPARRPLKRKAARRARPALRRR